MTKLSAHGTELNRREYPTCCVAVMSDGHILRNDGYGWRKWKRVKDSVQIADYVREVSAKYQARPYWFHRYVDALIYTVALKHRAELSTVITLMPEDPDGVWAHFDDRCIRLDIEDVIRACEAYRALMRERGIANVAETV